MGSASDHLDAFRLPSGDHYRFFDCRYIGAAKSALHEVVQGVMSSCSVGTACTVSAFWTDLAASSALMGLTMSDSKALPYCNSDIIIITIIIFMYVYDNYLY